MRKQVVGLVVGAVALSACGGDDDSSAASADEWCELAQNVEAASDEADDAFELGPQAMREAFEEFTDLLDQAAKAAPDDILADVNTAADAIDTFASIFDEVDYDLDALDPDRFAELEELGAESDAATQRIQEYNERECGIPVDDPDAEPSGTDDQADSGDPDGGDDPDDAGDSDDGEDSDDSADAGGEDFAGDANSAWCVGNRDLGRLGDRVEMMFLLDPEMLEAELGGLLDDLRELSDDAPAEIADDVATSLTGMEALDEALAEVDYDLLVADLSVLGELDDQMSAASDRISEYNEQVCGIADDDDDAEADDGSEFDPSAGSIRDQTIAVLVEQGFSEEEATCVFDAIDFTDPNVGEDASAILMVFDECGIDLARLAEIGESLGGLSE